MVFGGRATPGRRASKLQEGREGVVEEDTRFAAKEGKQKQSSLEVEYRRPFCPGCGQGVGGWKRYGADGVD